MTKKAVVLYEDALAEKAKEYPFHSLVVRCISDLGNEGCKMDYWMIDEVLHAVPCKGAGKIRRELRDSDRMDRWRKSVSGGPVIAVIDFDRVGDWVGKAVRGCKATTKAEITKELARPNDTRIVFLEKNMESVLERVRGANPRLVEEDAFRRAIYRKELLARDELLKRAAKDARVRDALMQMTSFRYLVNCIASCVA